MTRRWRARFGSSAALGRALPLIAAGLAGYALGRATPSGSSHTARHVTGGPSWRPRLLALVAIAAAVGMLILAFFVPRLAAAGWLTAFVLVSAIPLGSLELLMIHRLTGGRWGVSLRPLLEPAAAAIPLMALLFIPVLIALPLLYPWAGGSPSVTRSVALFYLNVPLFIVRTVIAFAGWSLLAVLVPRISGRAGLLLAGLGLTFHAVMMTLLSVDWILSAEPVFMSTSFGASVAIMQLLAALAFAAFCAPSDLEAQTLRDLGGLILAVTLGLTYIDFMALLVIWYSNLPDKVGWFVERTVDPWRWVAVGAFAFGAVLPILSLLLSRVRASRAALRWVASSSFIGLAFYVVYLLAPPFGPWAPATAALAALAIGCASMLFVSVVWRAALIVRARSSND